MTTSYNFEESDDFSIEFEKGVVDFSAYSYYIDSWGSGELSKEETYKLYLAMKAFYEEGE